MLRRPLLIMLLAAGALAASAVPSQALVVGLGDQKPDMFSDARFLGLGIDHVRLIVSYDALRDPAQAAPIDLWLTQARAAGKEPLVIFAKSRVPSRKKKLPSVKALAKSFSQFRQRYPWVRQYVPGNEPNLCSSRTCHNAKRAAQFYNAFRAQCTGCKILAANVVDTDDVGKWLKDFLKTARKPRLWGLHNYVDVNAGRSTGTRRMLKLVKGRIWFTETGGIVSRWKKSETKSANRKTGAFKVGIAPATKATGRVFKLARLSKRIERVYFYHWNGVTGSQWDSAFIGPGGEERPALQVLRDNLSSLRAAGKLG